jgi:RNA ligase-like protein
VNTPFIKGRRKRDLMSFEAFPKIHRLSRECIITEKIDGTNGLIEILDDFTTILIGSRTRYIAPEDDNYGFAKWVRANQEELLKLGPGRHHGEWWGAGIQRGYGRKEKQFSLFNTTTWNAANKPACCNIVPVLYKGLFNTNVVEECIEKLRSEGSMAAPGFMKPEGVVIYHIQGNVMFKKTLEKDEQPKGIQNA